MAESAQNIDTIGVGLTLDTSQFDTGLKKAQTSLAAFERSRSATLRAPQSMALSPQFKVTQAQVRGLRVDINQHMSAMAARNEAVAVPVKLGASDWAGMRQQIAQKIGTVPISVSISGGGTGGIRAGARAGATAQADPVQVLAAWIATTQGLSLPNAMTQLTRSARSKGISGNPAARRAKGGPVVQDRDYIVGEDGPEVYRFSRPGKIIPIKRRPGPWSMERASYDDELDAFRERSFPKAYRGKQVRGYGGKYGAAKPVRLTPETVPPDEPGFGYHGTIAIGDHGSRRGWPFGYRPSSHGDIRGGGRYGTGIPARAANWMVDDIPGWTGPKGPVSFWSERPRNASGYGTSMVRTRLNGSFSGPFNFNEMDPDQDDPVRYRATAQRTPLSRLQYWGDDDAWHRFRRGRAREFGGPAYRGKRVKGYGAKYGDHKPRFVSVSDRETWSSIDGGEPGRYAFHATNAMQSRGYIPWSQADKEKYADRSRVALRGMGDIRGGGPFGKGIRPYTSNWPNDHRSQAIMERRRGTDYSGWDAEMAS